MDCWIGLLSSREQPDLLGMTFCQAQYPGKDKIRLLKADPENCRKLVVHERSSQGVASSHGVALLDGSTLLG